MHHIYEYFTILILNHNYILNFADVKTAIRQLLDWLSYTAELFCDIFGRQKEKMFSVFEARRYLKGRQNFSTSF